MGGNSRQQFLRSDSKPDTEAAHEQAHKLTSSPGRCFSVAVVVGLIFAANGCSGPVGLSADANHIPVSSLSDSRKASTVFDAGVLFANEASYLCIPLEKLGIDPSQEIVSLKSSCECVRPSVIRYFKRQSQEGVALRLDFGDDSNGKDETSPTPLSVEIQFEFAVGAKQSVTIQLLHTTQIGKSIVMCDGDCNYNFGVVPWVIAKLEEGFDPTGSIVVCFCGMVSPDHSSFSVT